MPTRAVTVQGEKPSGKRPVDIDFDEIEAEISAPKKRKKSSVKGKTAKENGKSPGKGKSPEKGSCAGGSEQEQEADRKQRIEAIRKKAKDAFATDVADDDDDEEEIECGDFPSAPATFSTQP